MTDPYRQHPDEGPRWPGPDEPSGQSPYGPPRQPGPYQGEPPDPTRQFGPYQGGQEYGPYGTQQFDPYQGDPYGPFGTQPGQPYQGSYPQPPPWTATGGGHPPPPPPKSKLPIVLVAVLAAVVLLGGGGAAALLLTRGDITATQTAGTPTASAQATTTTTAPPITTRPTTTTAAEFQVGQCATLTPQPNDRASIRITECGGLQSDVVIARVQTDKCDRPYISFDPGRGKVYCLAMDAKVGDCFRLDNLIKRSVCAGSEPRKVLQIFDGTADEKRCQAVAGNVLALVYRDPGKTICLGRAT